MPERASNEVRVWQLVCLPWENYGLRRSLRRRKKKCGERISTLQKKNKPFASSSQVKRRQFFAFRVFFPLFFASALETLGDVLRSWGDRVWLIRERGVYSGMAKRIRNYRLSVTKTEGLFSLFLFLDRGSLFSHLFLSLVSSLWAEWWFASLPKESLIWL